MAGNTGGKVPNTPKARALGAALRQARESKGSGLRQFAAQLGRDPSMVSRWETGDRSPKPEDVARFLTVLGVEGVAYGEIMALTEGADEPLWLAATVPDQRRQLDALVDFENSATVITQVQPLLIPGLLQTNAYIRAVMSGGHGVREGEFGVRVAVRIGRREILTRTEPEPVRLVAYIGEAALWHKVGSTEVMSEQMRHLLTIGEAPNVTIRVVPRDAGWNPSWEGSFVLIDSGQQTPIVHVELRYSGLFFYDEDEDGGRYQKAAELVREVSLDPEESRKIISRCLRDGWESSR
jgi:transcriptional regulator with XRE-family HTH domain